MMESFDTKKKEIRCSRSFGKKVTQYSELVEAITTFVSRASFKARSQNTISGMIIIFVTTNPFDKRVRGYKANIAIPLEPPTNHTTIIIKAALRGLNKIYKENISYTKCGVILSSLTETEKLQGNLSFLRNKDAGMLVGTMDCINNKFDKHSLRLGTQPLRPTWGMRQLNKSQSYTTSWDDLLHVD
jgi:DNA polymerase V